MVQHNDSKGAAFAEIKCRAGPLRGTFMTERIQAFFASKKTQALSLTLGLLSMLLALLCFLVPLSREKWAVESLGETSVHQLSPLAMSMTHYEPQRLRYLLATGTTGPTYDKLTELLAQAKVGKNTHREAR